MSRKEIAGKGLLVVSLIFIIIPIILLENNRCPTHIVPYAILCIGSVTFITGFILLAINQKDEKQQTPQGESQ